MSTVLTEAIEQGVRPTLESFGEDRLDDARAMLDADNRNASRATYDGLYSVVTEEGDLLVLEYGSDADGARWAHEGRDPGTRPPLHEIQPWVELKLGVSPEESRGVAYVVARKIGKTGTEGTPFLTEPLEQHLQGLLADVGQASAEGLALGIELRFGAAQRYDVGSKTLTLSRGGSA